MKKSITLRIFSLAVAILTLLSLASCGAGVTPTKSYLDSNNHVIVEFSDGSTQDLGEIKASDVPAVTDAEDPGNKITAKEVKDVSVNTELHVIVEFSDGSTQDLGYVGVVDESKNITVKGVSVNADTHAIVEFSDGSTQDLGYIGVEVIKEVEPPLYTVTFVDINGMVLSTQEVYRGKAAKAPGAPAVADATFDKWDYDYTNVQDNVTIKPVYNAAAQYTVTFLSADGSVLKTENVISGHGATAPNAPTVAGKIFAGWDKNFSRVTSDFTVKATYRDPNTYTVTFKDYTGIVLGTSSVTEGNTATAPASPTRDGYSFTGWSQSLKNVTKNITATAQYKLNSGTNVLDIVSSISGSKLMVTVYLRGNVKVCGMEGNLAEPAGLTCTGVTAGTGDTTVNLKDGKIYFMFSSSTGKNVTAETKLFTATFSIGSASTANFTLTVDDIYDQGFVKVSYGTAGKNVRLK